MFQNPADDVRADLAHGSSGSAKLRRERQLRAMMRHETADRRYGSWLAALSITAVIADVRRTIGPRAPKTVSLGGRAGRPEVCS